MDRRILASTLCALALVGMPAMGAADTVPDRWLVYGAGVTTCGSWTADHELRQFKVQWLQGFLSGVNMTMRRPMGGSIADASDPAGYTAWIDSYCALNPLDTLSSAAEALGAELLKRKAAKP